MSEKQKVVSGKKNFVLRIDASTYNTLEKWAADEFRSVNAQIEYLLHRAIKENLGADKAMKTTYSQANTPETIL